MMKLVISFDEIGLDNGFSDNIEIAIEKRDTFLINQFPSWDIEEAFNFKDAVLDYDNMEWHIPMLVI